MRKYVVTAAQRAGIDLLDFVEPKLEVVCGRKNFKGVEKILGRQTIRKQMGGGTKSFPASRVFLTESIRKPVGLSVAKGFSNKKTLFLHVKQFSVPTVRGSIWNP